MGLWDYLISQRIFLTKELHCFLNNSGFFRNGTGEMPQKYVLTKIQASLPTPFFCVILTFWIHVVDSREERGTVSCMYECAYIHQARGSCWSCCTVWWVFPCRDLPSAPSAAQERHICIFKSYPLIKHLSFPEKGLISCIFWGVFSPQTGSEAMLGWVTQPNVREVLHKTQPQRGKTVLK